MAMMASLSRFATWMRLCRNWKSLMLDRDRLAAMSQAAMRKAEQHSWEQYRHQFVATVSCSRL